VRAVNELITASQREHSPQPAAATERASSGRPGEDVIGQNSYKPSTSDSSINDRRHI